MHNATKVYEPFDPTIASSPLISYWKPNECTNSSGRPEYSVDPKEIDNDPVMNKILQKPQIALDILKNIYYTMKRNGTLKQLNETKLGNFYKQNPKYFIL
jgi:hypothetical protein